MIIMDLALAKIPLTDDILPSGIGILQPSIDRLCSDACEIPLAAEANLLLSMKLTRNVKARIYRLGRQQQPIGSGGESVSGMADVAKEGQKLSRRGAEVAERIAERFSLRPQRLRENLILSLPSPLGKHDVEGLPEGLGYGLFAGVTDEFDVSIHIQDVGAIGNVIEGGGAGGESVEHDEQGALGHCSRSGTIVERRHEAFDAFHEPEHGWFISIAQRKPNITL